MTNQDKKPPISLEHLYPGQTSEWYAEAQDNFDAYLALIIRIYDRIRADPEAYALLQAELREGDRKFPNELFDQQHP